MQLIIDFTSSRPGGRMLILSPHQVIKVTAVFLVVTLAAVGAAAYAIATYWVSSDSAIVRTIVAREIHTQNEDRRRLFQESIGTLQEDIAKINARVIELYNKGASLSDHLGLPGQEMFSYSDVSDETGSFLCPIGGAAEDVMLYSPDDPHNPAPETSALRDSKIPSPEEQKIRIADFLHRQHRHMDVLERKYVSLRSQGMYNVVLGNTIPIERPIIGKSWLSSAYDYRRDPFTGRRAFHAGDDYAARRGTPVIAGADGIVIYAGRLGRYGNTIQLYHGRKISTLYAHLDKIHVKIWQHVDQGETIGTVGSTGRSTGSHLHYEVRVDNRPKHVRKTIKKMREQLSHTKS